MLKPQPKPKVKQQTKPLLQRRAHTLLATLGLAGLVSGCGTAAVSLGSPANAQALPSPSSTATVPPSAPSTASPTWTPVPTNTPSPSPTTWSTPTPWPTPPRWVPSRQALPTLAPVPVIPTTAWVPNGSVPVSYSPPDGVDVFGSTILRWEFYGQLAPDEFFDIKIKPLGSNDSSFVDWSKDPEYTLRPWSGWQPGLYTWQIGIVKGYLEGETKHFITDTGRDSEPFLIKWQPAGSGGGGGSGSGGAGGGGGGGGGSSGGS